MSMQLHCLRLLPSCLVTVVATGYQLPASNPRSGRSIPSNECPRIRPNDPKSGLCSCGRTSVHMMDAGSVPKCTTNNMLICNEVSSACWIFWGVFWLFWRQFANVTPAFLPGLAALFPSKRDTVGIFPVHQTKRSHSLLACIWSCVRDPSSVYPSDHRPVGRGRDSSYPPPPAQIRTSGITAYGSYLRS